MSTPEKRPSRLAHDKAEQLRDIAASSVDVYVGGISGLIGKVPSEALLRQAFIDGYLSCIELLLNMAEKGSS